MLKIAYHPIYSHPLPEGHRFPMLKYAYECGAKQGSYPIAFNRANEDAVNLFISHKIDYLSISNIVDQVLQEDFSHTPKSLNEIIEIDKNVHRKFLDLSKRFIIE